MTVTNLSNVNIVNIRGLESRVQNRPDRPLGSNKDFELTSNLLNNNNNNNYYTTITVISQNTISGVFSDLRQAVFVVLVADHVR